MKFPQASRLASLLSFLVWALLAACVVFWALPWFSPSGPKSAVPVASGVAPALALDANSLARVLGASAQTRASPSASAAPSWESRLALLGVVALGTGNSARVGAALIAFDGKPAKPYRVGATVTDGLVLRSVAPRRAVLAETTAPGRTISLSLAPPGSALASASSTSANANPNPELRPLMRPPPAPPQAEATVPPSPQPGPGVPSWAAGMRRALSGQAAGAGATPTPNPGTTPGTTPGGIPGAFPGLPANYPAPLPRPSLPFGLDEAGGSGGSGG